jgi:hypothetical protein
VPPVGLFCAILSDVVVYGLTIAARVMMREELMVDLNILRDIVEDDDGVYIENEALGGNVRFMYARV